MKNLLNKISLERMDTLPSRYGWKFNLDTKFKIKEDWRKMRYRNVHENNLRMHIDGIIRRGIGKDWNDVFSKIAILIRNLPYDFNLYYSISQVTTTYWDTREQCYYFCDIDNGRPIWRADDYLKKLHKIKFWRDPFYYIDPETNILSYIEPKPAIPQSKEQVRIHYEKKVDRRRSDRKSRKERKKLGLAQLKMINQPELFKFYNELIKKRKYLIDTIYKKPDTRPEIRYYKSPWSKKDPVENPLEDLKQRLKHYKWSCEHIKKQADKAKIEIIPIQEDIDKLEAGIYNAFFQSNAYLYSLQKECHHFENP